MARTRAVHSHGKFWQKLVISLDPLCEQGERHQHSWHQPLEHIPISVPQTPSIPSSRICWFGALCHLTPTTEAKHDVRVRRRNPYHCLWFDTICTSLRRDAHHLSGCRFWKWTLSVSFLTYMLAGVDCSREQCRWMQRCCYLVAPQQMPDAVLCMCLLRSLWYAPHWRHYQLAVKCVEVCTCVSKGVAKFLYHIGDVFGLS